jgi:CDP-diglyceride synthetase
MSQGTVTLTHAVCRINKIYYIRNRLKGRRMIVLVEMYVSLLPVILAGILNMVWVKSPFINSLKKPMDNGKILRDGKRLFGDNKTWKGFVGMIVLTIISAVIWGLACELMSLTRHNYLYRNYDNTLIYNLIIGFFLGLAYAVFELPNSFLKRRIDITPGKAIGGAKGVFFIFLDQADSIFGCVLVLSFVYEMSFIFYLLYVCVGAITHIVLNMLLYFLRLRKNMF